VKESGVELVLPLRASEKSAVQLLLSKQQWVLHHVGRLKSVAENRDAEAQLREGYALYQGRWLRVVEEPLRGPRPELIGDDLLVQSKEQAPRWVRNQARKILDECVERRSGMMNARAGNIGLSWRLVMAPPDVLDAIVVHELAHMYEPNHSKRFYDIVEQYCPDYKKHARWLKVNGWRLRV
jgi:predicted metal-dependent hydrolase